MIAALLHPDLLIDLWSPLANHQTRNGGGGNLAVLWVFLGAVATAGWLIFSELPFRLTLAVTAVGWLAVVGLSIWF